MRTVISFSEGCSGHFLAALLASADIEINFRIDTNVNLQALADSKVYRAFNMSALHNQHHMMNYAIAVTHESNYHTILEQLNPDRVIRIEPVNGIFTAIYNVYYKKLVNEDHPGMLDNWTSNPALHYDRAYEHLKTYYGHFSKRHWHPKEILFDFGWFYDDKQLQQFGQQIDVDIDLDSVHQYRKTQLPYALNLPTTTNMKDIVNQFSNDIFYSGPWFASYCLFCYEQVNQLKETQRLWSINDVGFLTQHQLIELADSYQL